MSKAGCSKEDLSMIRTVGGSLAALLILATAGCSNTNQTET